VGSLASLVVACVGSCASDACRATFLRAAAVYEPAVVAGIPSMSADMQRVRDDSWRNIGGLSHIKARLHQALIDPILRPAAYSRLGITPAKGVLLYGPPGCGKTLLIQAICAQGGLSFHYLDSASLLSAYVGASEARLREVFQEARNRAPSIIFFDEVDAIARARGSGRGGSGGSGADGGSGMAVRLLSTLLIEMDGAVAVERVCFVGATNLPHMLDPAVMRPGRFDEILYVPLPPAADRAAIVRNFFAKCPNWTFDADDVMHATEGFSGAEVTEICRRVAMQTIETFAAQHPLTAMVVVQEESSSPLDLTGELVAAASLLERATVNVSLFERFAVTFGGPLAVAPPS
jgi:SpoVK/Ycf46/Vps4 family AAA+-type ATPase